MSIVSLTRPSSGQHIVLSNIADARFVLAFPTDQVTVNRSEDGNSLLFIFSDEASIELKDFYSFYSQNNLPEFEVEGVGIAGADFFTTLVADLAPAAGQEPSFVQVSDGSTQWYDTMDLLSGVNHLDGTDIHFTKEVEEEIAAEPEMSIEFGTQPAEFERMAEVNAVKREGFVKSKSSAESDFAPEHTIAGQNDNDYRNAELGSDTSDKEGIERSASGSNDSKKDVLDSEQGDGESGVGFLMSETSVDSLLASDEDAEDEGKGVTEETGEEDISLANMKPLHEVAASSDNGDSSAVNEDTSSVLSAEIPVIGDASYTTSDQNVSELTVARVILEHGNA